MSWKMIESLESGLLLLSSPSMDYKSCVANFPWIVFAIFCNLFGNKVMVIRGWESEREREGPKKFLLQRTDWHNWWLNGARWFLVRERAWERSRRKKISPEKAIFCFYLYFHLLTLTHCFLFFSVFFANIF